MAIQFARTEIVSAGKGSSAVGLSAYIARADRRAEATDRAYAFEHRDDDLEHLSVYLPKDAPAWMRDGRQLWNAVEEAELTRDRKTGEVRFKKNAQLAKHTVLALPKELDVAEQRDMLERFIHDNYTSKGVAVEAAIHRPHEGGDNWHAHLMVTTREITKDGVGKKARHLNPTFSKGRTEGDEIGQRWTDFQNAYFQEKGLDLSVDPTASIPYVHEKTGRFVEDSDVRKENETRREKHIQAILEKPQIVAAELTAKKPYFTEREVSRYLFKAELDGEEFDRAKAGVMAHGLALYDRETGKATDKFTTKEVRQQEREILAEAGKLAARNRHRVLPQTIITELALRNLSEEQQKAYMSAVDNGRDLSVWRGAAGTGKSHIMNAARAAYERDGYHVIGLAPTNTVARDMGRDGFKEARTAHSFLARVELGKQRLDSSTVIFIDEAAMMDNVRLGGVLKHASRAGAKVILIGDDRQLASIERGGMFTAIREKHGASELRQVRRQKEDWAKQASLDFADGRFEEAVKAYEAREHITWAANTKEARSALVEAWKRDTGENSTKVRFVYAQTNKDVNEINAALRQVRQQRGELGSSHAFDTVRGQIELAEQDRIQFYENDREAGIFNGYVGTVERIDGARLTVLLDNGRQVKVDTERFRGFGHGYAGTVYRGQGKTQSETYYLHTPLSDSRTSYVAMTRHKDNVSLFVGRETTPDARSLARQMGRVNDRGPSLRYLTKEELDHAKAQKNQPQKMPTLKPTLGKVKPPSLELSAEVAEMKAMGKDRQQENAMTKTAKSTPKVGGQDAAQALRQALTKKQPEDKEHADKRLGLGKIKLPSTEAGRRLMDEMKQAKTERSRSKSARKPDHDMER